MDDGTCAYVSRWFISYESLVRQSGGIDSDIRALLDAGAAPGVIYSVTPEGRWWSALGSRHGKFANTPPADGRHWYASAALYWLRRGLLSMRKGLAPNEAADANQAHFAHQFYLALLHEPLAKGAFPGAFKHDAVDRDGASTAAANEWGAWQDGGYAVCLMSFTGGTCVQKEALAFTLRRQRVVGNVGLDDEQVLDLIERLDSLILPFAPFQRPTGTPGFAIDRLLHLLSLGAFEAPGGLA